MASGVLMNITEEATCRICLDLLKEPLCLDCGHSFCQACITANNKKSMMDKEGECHCPVCRLSYQPGNLRLNLHLSNIVKMLREVKCSPEEEQNRDLCDSHGEKLLLFCKEDGKIICWLCERSQEHHSHHTFLMEEVAQEFKEKLQEALEKLKVEQQKAEELGADLEKQRTSWKDLIENESQSVQVYFKKLREILDSEEQKKLEVLKEEERHVLNDLAQTQSELVQQSQILKGLISDLEFRLQGSTLEMLQDVNSIMERSDTFTLMKPKSVYKIHERVFQPPDLKRMPVLNGLTDVQRYWVHVTLDPPMHKSNVSISNDRRQVTPLLRSTNPNFVLRDPYEDYGVLGLPVITSGEHYWEVDVSDKYTWALGVYGDNCPDSNMMGFVRQGNNYQHVCSRYKPKYGYWVIGLQNHSEYKAFVDSAPSNASTVTLTLTVPPRCVGVFLDYNAGTVSFFNISNHGFLIYKFSSCSFPKKMFPYFNPMLCAAPMTLCSPRS